MKKQYVECEDAIAVKVNSRPGPPFDYIVPVTVMSSKIGLNRSVTVTLLAIPAAVLPVFWMVMVSETSIGAERPAPEIVASFTMVEPEDL